MRPKMKALVLFTTSALATASLAFAPRAQAYWRFVHAGSGCFYSNYAFGFYSVEAAGQLSKSGPMGVRNTDSRDAVMICPDNNDSNTWGGPYTPYIGVRLYRPYATSQTPRVQACSNVASYGSSGCTGYMTSSATGFMQLNFSAAAVWRYNAMNYVYVPLDATNQSWAAGIDLMGVTIGNEFGPF